MKRSTGKWVLTVMAAALMTAPAAAQTPPPQPPATAQPTTPQSAPATPQTTQAGSAQEHLRAASAALNDVQLASLSARAKTQVNELKRRLTALERSDASSNASATAETKRNPRATASKVNWGTEVAAMDKILASLLDAPATTGTTGTTGTAGAGKAAAAVTLDDASRAKLTEVRTHLTAYAAAMAGGTSGKDDPAATPEPAAPATSSTPPPTAQPPAGATPPAGTPPPTSAAQPPAASTPATTPQTTPAQADAEGARRHLSEARNSLSALTQLPAAGQLAGEARTQISQLISNFNELITTQSNWRDAYAKVNANMTALLGADPTATSTTGTTTPGAVGTSGTPTITLDPAIREKLVEMRKHLVEFEKASSGGASSAAPPAATPDPATATPPATPPTTPPATATSGTTATSSATTGTPGTTPATTDAPQTDWMKHITAIELMLRSQDESGGLTLDKAKVEMLRTHIAELRKLLERK